MALLHFLRANAEKFGFSVRALNVEHGIRGESSIKDSEFVKQYCLSAQIPLIEYSVKAKEHAKNHKLSVEQSARQLRYECFYDAINTNKCQVVATAHHALDNLESVLFNLFRGTGIKGAIGINQTYSDKIIRPFLKVTKSEIEEYISQNSIPFVTDETNLSDDYSRNFIRHNVIPKVKELFPDVENSVARFSELLQTDSDYLDSIADESFSFDGEKEKISVYLDRAIFSRAVICALKKLGVKKDWEKTHVDAVFALSRSESGKTLNLPQGVIAVKEYEFIVLTKQKKKSTDEIALKAGRFEFEGQNVTVTVCEAQTVDLKKGLYLATEKLPDDAVIRTRRVGDLFTKFGGGTKSLSDYFTDLKVPPTRRDFIPLIASKNNVLAIFGIAISDTVKADENTRLLFKLD